MTWVRFDDQFPIHRKVAGLTDAAFRLHVSAIPWCSRNLTDGVVPTGDLDDVCARVRTPQRFAAELVGRGLWHDAGEECGSEHCSAPSDEGWVIHDYLGFQPSRSKVLQVKKVREEAGRTGGQRSGEVRRSRSKASGSKSKANGKQVGSRSLEPRPVLPLREEGADVAPLRGGGAPPPPTPTRTLTTGRVVCATHHQELPCISCQADAKVLAADEDLDQRPPVPQNPAKQPKAVPANPDELPLRQRIRTERAVAAGWLAGRPDVKRHLDAAVDQLLAAGTEVPSAEDIAELAAALAIQTERKEPT